MLIRNCTLNTVLRKNSEQTIQSKLLIKQFMFQQLCILFQYGDFGDTCKM